MRNMLLHLIATALAVIAAGAVLREFVEGQHIYYSDYVTLGLFALILGLLNAVLTPILNLITFPLACLTFGLFRIVVSIVVFLIAAELMPDERFTATPLGAAVAVLLIGLVSGVLTLTLGEGQR